MSNKRAIITLDSWNPMKSLFALLKDRSQEVVATNITTWPQTLKFCATLLLHNGLVGLNASPSKSPLFYLPLEISKYILQKTLLIPVNLFNWRFDFSQIKPINQLAFKDCQMSQTQLRVVIAALNTNIQQSINFSGNEFNQGNFDRLVKKIKDTDFHGLNIANIGNIDKSKLLEDLKTNKISAKKLVIDKLFENNAESKLFFKTNSHLCALVETKKKAVSKHLEEHLLANRWLHDVRLKNRGDQCHLEEEELNQKKFSSLAKIMDEYSEFFLTAKVSEKSLEEITQRLAKTDKTITFQLNCANARATERSFKTQLNANKAINYYFNGPFSYFARSFAAVNTITQNVIFTAGVTFLFGWGGAILLGLGVMAVVSNKYFHNQLLKTKEDGFWNDESRISQFISGYDCAETWGPWFYPKSWTTPGYVGFYYAKNHITTLPIIEESNEEISQENKKKQALT